MARRITLILDDDVYKRLVEESIRRYGSVKYISRVVNEILREVFKLDLEDEALKELARLLSKPKIARVTPEDMEKFREELSQRLES